MTTPEALRPRPHLNDDIVALRQWTTGDAPALADAVAASQTQLGAWLAFAAAGHYTRHDAQQFIAGAHDRWEASHSYAYAITVHHGQIAGCITLRNYGEPEMSLGYWLDTRHTGNGYATAAARLLTVEAIACGAATVRIEHDQANPRSGDVAHRLGYRLSRQGPVDRPVFGARTGIELLWRYPPGTRS